MARSAPPATAGSDATSGRRGLRFAGRSALEDVQHGDIGAVQAGVQQSRVEPAGPSGRRTASRSRPPAAPGASPTSTRPSALAGVRRGRPGAALDQLRAAGAPRDPVGECESTSAVTRGPDAPPRRASRTSRSRSHPVTASGCSSMTMCPPGIDDVHRRVRKRLGDDVGVLHRRHQVLLGAHHQRLAPLHGPAARRACRGRRGSGGTR